MKKILIVFLFLAFAVSAFGQNMWKPIPADLFTASITADRTFRGTSVWLPRPMMNIVAVKWWIDKDTKKIDFSPFSSVAFGIGYQYYVPTSDTDLTPYNKFGADAVLIMGENVCAGMMINYNLSGEAMIRFGVDYNFPLKRLELLTTVKFDL